MKKSNRSLSHIPLKFAPLSNKLVILPIKPLGTVLKRTGLVSSSQIEEALQKQKEHTNLKIGEILSERGWLQPETADFFAEKFWMLLDRPSKEPIGYYFKEAALLSEQQIATILSEQQNIKLKFGEIAVKKGWIEQETLDFFLEYLVPGDYSSSQGKKTGKDWNVADKIQYERNIHDRFLEIKLKLLDLEGVENISPQVFEAVLYWTKGQSFLSQKLCQLIARSDKDIPHTEVGFQVKRLVETRIIENWQEKEAAKHFKNLRSRLLNNKKCLPKNLLETYKKIYREKIAFDNSPEQVELLDLGLISEEKHELRVANPIYRAVFDLNWVERELPGLNYSLVKAAQKGELLADDTKHANKKPFNLSWRSIILFIGFAGLVLLLFQMLAKRLEVRTLFRSGNELLNEQQYEAAISQYNQLLEIDSNYYQAWANRGYALARLQEYEKMLASCSAATLIEPTAVYAWNCQGEALHNLQRHQEAAAIFDRAIAIEPQDPIFWINKSESLISLKQYDESLAAIDEAINLLMKKANKNLGNRIENELAIAWNYKGKALSAKQEYNEAIASYERSLEYKSQYYPAQIGKAVALKQLQKYDESSQQFLSILNNPDLTDNRRAATWFYLGKTLCESSQVSSAIAAFETSLKYQPDYQAAAIAKENCQ